tara:strand:- start:18413 stop:19291 length:879 start_codon:yes stop_codon:yes gene_type:complete
MKTDILETISEKIAELMETNQGEWIKPFTEGELLCPHNPVTGKDYSGMNAFWLGMMEDEYYATFNQWQELGAKVKKGEKAIFALRPYTYTPKDSEGKPETDSQGNEKKITAFKDYPVFGASQVEGWEPPKVERVNKVKAIAKADFFLENLGSTVHFINQGRAFYNRSTDEITMPTKELFIDTKERTATEAFYSVWLHEEVHKTGAPNRLNRTKGGSFGDKDYAFEELVAEIGASILCKNLGIAPEIRQDHAEYIGSWIKALRNDKKYIKEAVKLSLEAVAFMETLQQNKAVA